MSISLPPYFFYIIEKGEFNLASKTLITKIKQRIDTTANWTTNSSVVLANGELGFERTTSGAIKFKVGDGTSTWAQLNYITVGSESSGSASDEIYVGTSAPASGHNYTMWINPNGDELEVSGTYDIILTYEKTSHDPFDTSVDDGDYDNLEYYLNIDDITHQSLLTNPETGCQLSYNTDWDTILEKYQANQTLVLNFQVAVDEDIYTWKLPLLAALLDDNDGGAFSFGYCDNEYFYNVIITDNFGIENASNPIWNLTELISSMPEVDDETITIDETTGKLRTTYGDEIETNDVILNINYNYVLELEETNTGFIGIEDILDDGNPWFMCQIQDSSFLLPNPTTPAQTYKILLNEDTTNPIITGTLQQEVLSLDANNNITINYIGDITLLYGVMMQDSTSLEKIATGDIDYDYIIGTAENVPLDDGIVGNICLMFFHASYLGNFDEKTDTLQIYGPGTSNIKIPTTASPHKAGKGIQIDNDGKINVLYGKETGTTKIRDIEIDYVSSSPESYIAGTAYGYRADDYNLYPLNSFNDVDSMNRIAGNKIQVYAEEYDWDSENQEHVLIYSSQVKQSEIYSYYKTDETGYTTYTITFKYGTQTNYEEIKCNLLAQNDPSLSTLKAIDNAGNSVHRFIGFYNTTTDLSTWLSTFSLTPEHQDKEALGFYLSFDPNLLKWWFIIFSNVNDLDLDDDNKAIFQDREIKNYGDSSKIFIGKNCEVKKQYSIALGKNTIANEYYSTALGENTITNGYYSTALGENTIANGRYSIATGEQSIANGDYSIASGHNTITLGQNSVALGSYTTAQGDYSIALGDNTTTYGYASIALGDNTIAQGGRSTALGYHTTAYGDASIALGDDTIAKGSESIAAGNTTIALGNNSFTLGNSTLAAKYNSVSFGNGETDTILLTYISGAYHYSSNFIPRLNYVLVHEEQRAIITAINTNEYTLELSGNFNSSNFTEQQSVKCYKSGIAYGENSFVAGANNRALENYQAVVGIYNADNSNALFMVGGGNSSTIPYDDDSAQHSTYDTEEQRVNAFEVEKNGCYRNKLVYNKNNGVYTKKYRLWDTSLALPSTNAANAKTATDTSDIVTQYNDLVSKYNSLVSALQSAGIILPNS